MSPFSNLFEKKWFFIMMFLYVFIMIPFSFHYNTEYDPSWLGIPNYIFGWIFNGCIVMAAILLWRHQCMKRPEYQDEEEGQ